MTTPDRQRMIRVRDIRPGDVLDLHGVGVDAVVAATARTETSDDHLMIDYRTGSDAPDQPPHRHAVRRVTQRVPLLRRAGEVAGDG